MEESARLGAPYDGEMGGPVLAVARDLVAKRNLKVWNEASASLWENPI